jgi:hypothetical protein
LNMKKFPLFWSVILISLGLVGVIALVTILNRPEKVDLSVWQSSPTQVRGYSSPAFQQLANQPSNGNFDAVRAEREEKARDFLNSIELQQVGTLSRLKHHPAPGIIRSVADSGRPFREYTAKSWDGLLPATVALDNNWELQWEMTQTGEYPVRRLAKTELVERLKTRSWDPLGIELNQEDVIKTGPEDWGMPTSAMEVLPFNGKIPNYRFYFKVMSNSGELNGDYQLVDFTAWDRSTHYSLSHHLGNSNVGAGFNLQYLKQGPARDRLVVNAPLAIWRPTPVRLVMDIAVGPLKVTQLDPEKALQEPALYADCGVALVALTSGSTHIVPKSFKMANHEIVWQSTSSLRTSIALVELNEPGERIWNLLALDHQGREIPVKNLHQINRTQFKEIQRRKDEIASIQIVEYPHRFRVFWDLPFAPGTPKENDGIANLFETRIPLLLARNEQDIIKLVSSAAQLSGIQDRDTQHTVYPTYFPVAYQDVTVRDIIKDWVEKKNREGRAFYNPESAQIILDPSAGEAWLNWVKRNF